MDNLNIDKSNKVNGSAHEYKKTANKADSMFDKLAHTASDQISKSAEDFADQGIKAYETGRDYVRSNPVTGVLVAAGTGLVLGSYLVGKFMNRQQQ